MPSGDPLTRDASGNWGPAASYQYVEACTSTHSSSCTVYRYASDNVLYKQKTNGTWQLVQSAFNGVIYANGNIDRFTGPLPHAVEQLGPERTHLRPSPRSRRSRWLPRTPPGSPAT